MGKDLLLSRRDVLAGLSVSAATLAIERPAIACTTPDPTPTPDTPKPIWFSSPNSVPSDVLARYNAKKSYYISYLGFDANRDGIFDGTTLEYSKRIAAVPATFNGPVSMDWEGTANSTFGMTNFALGIGGFNGDSVQNIAEREGTRCFNAFKRDRPNALWGFYDVPRSNQPACFLPSYSRYAKFMGQDAVISSTFWALTNVVHQRAYITYKQSATDSADPVSSGTCSRAQLKTMYTNMAMLGLKCAERSGWRAKVIPYISRNYYYSRFSFDHTAAPLEWIYWHVYYFCQTTYNGRKADGVFIWDGSSTSPMTEAELKAIYQGANGLPYDPSMARP
jgi:hypothetical protein